MSNIGTAFVNGFVNDDKYKTMLNNGTQQATFMKAPYEISSGAVAAGLLRKPAIYSAGLGQVLDEQAKQEEQVRANAANNTGSPYAANSFVDSYLRHNNYQQMRLAQRSKGRYTGNAYMTIPFLLAAAVAILILFRKIR